MTWCASRNGIPFSTKKDLAADVAETLAKA